MCDGRKKLSFKRHGVRAVESHNCAKSLNNHDSVNIDCVRVERRRYGKISGGFKIKSVVVNN